MKTRKPIILSIISAVIVAVMFAAMSCAVEDVTPPATYTMTFETYGGTEIEPITAMAGSMIIPPDDPIKADNTFEGWYTNESFDGEAVKIPQVMPDGNVTYHAKFAPVKTEYTVTYQFNLGKVPHAADIDAVTVQAGETVTVADGNDYGAQGYMFKGWSTDNNGLVTPDIKQNGQYDAGDVITVTADITLYAQWAMEYTDAREQNADKIYVYAPLIGKGKGAARLVRADKQKQDLDGFVASGSETSSGYTEFTFYSDEFQNGSFEGRLYGDGTYATADGLKGNYCRYELGYDEVWYQCILALDGFGYATYSERSGSLTHVVADGDYELGEDGDFVFMATMETDSANAKPQELHFMIEAGEVEDTMFDGMFMFRGEEYGMNMLYDPVDRMFEPYIIDLNGYGGASIIELYQDSSGNTQSMETLVGGTYGGYGENYETYQGEWKFYSDDTDKWHDSRFILTVVQSNDGQYLYSFIECDETVEGVYTASDGSTLYIDGYGMAEYKALGATYIGICTVKESIATFVQQIQNADGSYKTGETLVFTLLPDTKFAVSKGGFNVSADGVLTGYTGVSSVVEIPETTEGEAITITAIGDKAFSKGNQDVEVKVSLVSVTIPQTVTSIGQYAFQNEYTLRRAVFLSPTPFAIDFSTDGDPFRWGAGDFTIVVPEDAVDAYKAECNDGGLWAGCKYTIKGSEEILVQPEFEIENGVLVRYNKPDGKSEIVIDDSVTEIADNVFRGLSGITKVDLNNVTKLGESAFYGCEDLVEVLFTKVEQVGGLAFAACYNLNNSGTKNVLELPAVKSIGESAFSGCESLKHVKLGQALQSIGDFAFYLCNVNYADPETFEADTLMVELMGENPPQMGSKITLGNIVFRFKVQSVEIAIKCFAQPTWNAYCRHLYIGSGNEKGTYISGDSTLVLDGRAVYQSSYVWMYKLEGSKITFYEFDESTSTYTTNVGTYSDNVITVAIAGRTRHFTRVEEKMTFTTKDGKYTLECDPMDLQPDNYPNYSGYADVKFNGKDVQLYINGYNIKTIYEFEENGSKYDISVSFNGDVMDITKKLSPVRYTDITADDGSKITILIQNDKIYILTADFEINVDTDRKLYWTEASGMGVIAAQNGNVFTFSFGFRQDTYSFTVTVSEDYKTFSYTYTKS